ncbi:DinB family protein [Nocardioides euryhalodurans]|uniref:DinB family protein n=1 Tax=Nocardioides euryhalodurans TaxID=2518370 RepID=A0A4P7GNN4_9ACTN|nr:DinB family protein [Nocardioides euryhalodurans]QBR93700.1 DinB family protein [Nocardioides euryhalodurans]
MTEQPERKEPDMWVDPEDDPRSQEVTRGERDTVLGYLDAYRKTLVMKCEGLTPEQLATASVPPSNLTLLGLVRHMAAVEQSWFRRVMDRHLELPRLYGKAQDRDADFTQVEPTQECVDEAFASLAREVSYAEDWVAAHDLDDLGEHPDGEIELRDVLVHMVEEYARHCGHADLLRECLDGRTGQ